MNSTSLGQYHGGIDHGLQLKFSTMDSGTLVQHQGQRYLGSAPWTAAPWFSVMDSGPLVQHHGQRYRSSAPRTAALSSAPWITTP
ncbi:hypothetical protein CesoFtcFv8_027384 [Champsocephalus esox]|uniref:Uncharacterized protein n=1 Tax=Champsocephalus esox TaxID=159716 RepID=A0AAN7Y7G6_9TELE|nr:hypothetical protein CesoFtcFv8_027384 [Champsocephalus esox]